MSVIIRNERYSLAETVDHSSCERIVKPQRHVLFPAPEHRKRCLYVFRRVEILRYRVGYPVRYADVTHTVNSVVRNTVLGVASYKIIAVVHPFKRVWGYHPAFPALHKLLVNIVFVIVEGYFVMNQLPRYRLSLYGFVDALYRIRRGTLAGGFP